MRHLRGKIRLNIIDQVRHAVLIEYWNRVGSIAFNSGLYSILYEEKSYSGLNIDGAFLLMKKTISKRNRLADIDGA